MISPRHIRRSIVAISALSLGALATPASSATQSPPEPIAAARHRPLGSTVTVRGTVTVPTNAFDRGFAVQDLVDGIYVRDSGSAPRALGDDVEITGTLVDSSGLLAIQPASITARGHGREIRPRERSTGSVGEPTEGRLLELKGQMVGDLIDDGPYGFKLHIDDGSGPVQIFLFPGTGITAAHLHTGVSIKAVCFSNQYEATVECSPRQPSDLVIK